jgi:hypothetical protein
LQRYVAPEAEDAKRASDFLSCNIVLCSKVRLESCRLTTQLLPSFGYGVRVWRIRKHLTALCKRLFQHAARARQRHVTEVHESAENRGKTH